MWTVCFSFPPCETYHSYFSIRRSDVDLYCIFDGHDGHSVAEVCAKQFAQYLWDQMREIAKIEDFLLPESIYSFFYL
jgi:serine/threonine protein phosphatase PrpC